jgi:integrase
LSSYLRDTTLATKPATATAERKVVPLTLPKAERKRVQGHRERFWIIPFFNLTGTQSWRVTGSNRAGKQIRENFNDLKAAQCRQVELLTEYLGSQTETQIRATKLTDTQLRLCEAALCKLDCDDDLLPAVDYWLRHGKHKAVAESPRLDEAVEKFQAWLAGAKDENGNHVCTLRELTRNGLRNRINTFQCSIGNLRVNDITTETVEGFLGKLRVSPATRDGYRRNVSRFFSWCIERPRRWVTSNPCHEIKFEKGEQQPPRVLTVKQCKTLLSAAEPKGLAPYVAVCLFAGLRPFEAVRLDWGAVNLEDREIRLEATQTKTKRARVVAVSDTLLAWLQAYKGKPFVPINRRRKFNAVKRSAGFGTPNPKHPDLRPWPVDVMRHTVVSHYFRLTGSYGRTAEQFGNSEAVIKNHYQGRVTSKDTKQFYALRRTKGESK